MGFPDIYAIVMLRSLSLASSNGRCGMIVPLSLTFSEDFVDLRKSLEVHGSRWFSSYDNIPAAVFSGVSQRCTIWLSGHGNDGAHSTPMYRWRSAARPNLVESLTYASLGSVTKETRGIPKLGSANALSILNSITEPKGKKQREILATGRLGGDRIGFSQAARNFVSAFREDPPCLDGISLKSVPASQNGDLKLSNDEAACAVLSVLLGETLFSYWLAVGDGFHVTGGVLKDFIGCLNYLDTLHFAALVDLGKILHARRHEALVFKKNAGKYVGNYNYRTLHGITRRADLTLMMALRIEPKLALSVLNDVQCVLAINEFAGEKGIPPAVKEVLRPLPRNIDQETKRLAEIDAALITYYGLKRSEYEFVLNRDVVLYGAAADEDGSELGDDGDE